MEEGNQDRQQRGTVAWKAFWGGEQSFDKVSYCGEGKSSVGLAVLLDVEFAPAPSESLVETIRSAGATVDKQENPIWSRPRQICVSQTSQV